MTHRIARHLLDGVAEGVAQVQHCPPAALIRVFLHHGALDGDGPHQQRLQIGPSQPVGGQRPRVEVPLLHHQPLPQQRVGDEAVLGHFGQTGGELGRRQGGQRAHVGQHRPRLLERADEVLALGHVHARLAADAGVHHGQQASGAEHELHAAQVGGGHEAGHVADHAAAEGDDRPRSVQPGAQ